MTLKTFQDLPEALRERFIEHPRLEKPKGCYAKEFRDKQRPIEFEDGSLGWWHTFEVFVPDDHPVPITAFIVGRATGLLSAAEGLLARLDSMTTEEFAMGGDRKPREKLRKILSEAKTGSYLI